MKTLILSLVICVTSLCQAQSKSTNDSTVIYTIVDTLAEFPGGHKEFAQYIKNNLMVPAIVHEGKVSVRTFIKFAVFQDGTIHNIEILRKSVECPECDTEAIRVIKNSPNWIPGKLNGRAVNSWYTLPLSFRKA